MTNGTRQEDATLLDVLVDGFEKNEVHHGFRWRELPLPDDSAAARKFASFLDEALRWKGAPLQTEDGSGRQLALWSDLEIRRAGRAVLVRVKASHFDNWWHPCSRSSTALQTAVRSCFQIIALAPVVFAVACANATGSCNGEAVGDRKIRAECDAPYFKQVPGCVKDVNCASFDDVVSCQAASCAISSQGLCSNGFGACEFDGGAVPTDQAACEETPSCRWDSLCLTAADCTSFHTQDSCAAVPYCDWEANSVL